MWVVECESASGAAMRCAHAEVDAASAIADGHTVARHSRACRAIQRMHLRHRKGFSREGGIGCFKGGERVA